MERLFPAGCFIDFGPLHLDSSGSIPPSHRIHGATPAKLRAELRVLCPRKAGVYGMVDSNGELLYVGKAKNLRVRLQSYFRKRGRPAKAGKIIRRTTTVVWEVQPGEFAALLRELELIRRWRPRGNVQGQPLRRKHAFICLGRRPAPYVFLHQKPPKTALAVFGPVPMNLWAGEAVRRLNDLFRLRDCPQKQEMIFPDQRALFTLGQPGATAGLSNVMAIPPGCMRFDLGSCLGPCTGTCARRDYQTQVKAARSFLEGKDRAALTNLEREMHLAAAAQEFERAGVLRDKWRALAWLTTRLDRLRETRQRLSFAYPQGERWYLIHGGRTIRAIPAPHDRESALEASALLRAIYSRLGNSELLESYEHMDGVMLVSAWFRKHPGELKRTLAPEQALAKCLKLTAGNQSRAR
ncbi:MAG: GIY-YIG nuclease family protein [Planctomycetes bacterium]|nr:GIY-YIG nuclease family protein [Planctomycetota bacterium]